MQERRFVCSYIVLLPITRLQSRNLSHSNAVESVSTVSSLSERLHDRTFLYGSH